MREIGLGPAQLATVFPFYVAFTHDLRIVQVGSAWTRAGSEVRPGVSMADCFRLVRPALPVDPSALRAIQGTLVVAEVVSTGLRLRGQVLPSAESDDLLFIGSPQVQDLGDLKRFGLSLDDWPHHESTGDFLFLLRSKELALAEGRALSERLSRQSSHLQSAVREWEEAQAIISAREASLRAILDTAADGIVTIDDHGLIQSFNRAAARLFGYSEAEMLGRNVSMLMPPPYNTEHDAYLERYRRTGVAAVVGRGREVEGLRRDGTRFPLYLSVSEVTGPKGPTFTGILHDLSEAKLARQALEAVEARTRLIVDTALDAVITIDQTGVVTLWNSQAEAAFGWTREEAIGRPLADLIVPPRFRDAHLAGLRRYLAGGGGHLLNRRIEITGLHRDGREFPVELAITPIKDGDALSFSAFVRDITDRKRAERRLELALESSGLVMFDWDVKSGQVQLGAEWWRMLGEDAAARVTSIADLEQRAHPDDRPALRSQATALLAGTVDVYRVEHRLETRDRGWIWIESMAKVSERDAAGQAIRVSGANRDITDRRRAEQLLRLQYETTRILAFDVELPQAASRLLRAASQYLGWSVGALWTLDRQAGGLRCIDLWHEPGLDIAAFAAHTRSVVFPLGVGLPGRAAASGEYVWLPGVTEDSNFPRAPGARQAGLGSGIALPITVTREVQGVIEFFSRQFSKPAEAEIEALSSLAGQIGHFIERKDALDALRQSEARLRSVTENMLEGLVLVGQNLRILQANPAFARIFDYRQDELVGMAIAELLPDRPDYRDPPRLAERVRQSLGRATEQEGRRRTGEVFPLQLQAYEVSTPDGPVLAGSVRDLSHERESDRLKKRFVASVSHELRTPLTALRGSLGLLAQGAVGTLAPDAAEVVAMAERNAVRLVDIINDLLDFERIQSGLLLFAPDYFQLDRAIERSRESVQTLAHESGTAIVAIASGVRVWGDEARIVQVLVNLLANAIKFSPSGTRVEISVRSSDTHAEVRVRDHGRGIPVALQATIFQPFRQVEESDAREHGGSGLGLAICRAIVTQQGGEIGVESRPGEGATFWFTIPLRPGGLTLPEA